MDKIKGLTDIQRLLNKSKSLRQVARETGLNNSTLTRLKDSKDCKLSTYIKLKDYFNKRIEGNNE